MMIRLKAFDPEQGHVLRDYCCRSMTFVAGVVQSVDAEMAEYLLTVRQTSGDEQSPIAFELVGECGACVCADGADSTTETREPYIRPSVEVAAGTVAVERPSFSEDEGEPRRAGAAPDGSASALPALSDEAWAKVQGLLPVSKPGPQGGRPPIDNRAVLAGVLYALGTGTQWAELPAAGGCCGNTCWRRLRRWQALGVWDRIRASLADDPQFFSVKWPRAERKRRRGASQRVEPEGQQKITK